jgi:hypothetical protein
MTINALACVLLLLSTSQVESARQSPAAAVTPESLLDDSDTYDENTAGEHTPLPLEKHIASQFPGEVPTFHPPPLALVEELSQDKGKEKANEMVKIDQKTVGPASAEKNGVVVSEQANQHDVKASFSHNRDVESKRHAFPDEENVPGHLAEKIEAESMVPQMDQSPGPCRIPPETVQDFNIRAETNDIIADVKKELSDMNEDPEPQKKSKTRALQLRILKHVVSTFPLKAAFWIGAGLNGFCLTGWVGWGVGAIGMATGHIHVGAAGFSYAAGMTPVSGVLHGIGIPCMVYGSPEISWADKMLRSAFGTHFDDMQAFIDEAKKFDPAQASVSDDVTETLEWQKALEELEWQKAVENFPIDIIPNTDGFDNEDGI